MDPRIVLVCGDRNWINVSKMRARLGKLPTSCMIIEGGAAGADRIAGMLADEFGMPHATVNANWNFYKKAAGPIRNRWMLDLKPDLVIAFHSDMENSKGTKDCLAEARKRNIKTELIK